MRNVACICDRCANVVTENVSVIAVTAGPLRMRRDVPIDLCPKCQDKFDEFLRAHQDDAWNDLQTKTDDSPTGKKRRTTTPVEASQC